MAVWVLRSERSSAAPACLTRFADHPVEARGGSKGRSGTIENREKPIRGGLHSLTSSVLRKFQDAEKIRRRKSTQLFELLEGLDEGLPPEEPIPVSLAVHLVSLFTKAFYICKSQLPQPEEQFMPEGRQRRHTEYMKGLLADLDEMVTFFFSAR